MREARRIASARAVAYQRHSRLVELIQTEVACCAVWNEDLRSTQGETVNLVDHRLLEIETLLLLQ
jgi:hypothetical protein